MRTTVDRTSLERQCAEAGFPSGVRVPLVMMVVVLALLMGFCAIRLSGTPDGSPVEVVARSHQWFAANLAHSAGASVNEAVADLATAVKLYSGKADRTDEQTIAFFAKNCPHARGVAVVDTAGGLRATAGEPVPIESVPLDDIASVPVRVMADRYGGVQAVTASALPGGDRVVVVSSDLIIPPVSVDSLRLPETVLLVTDGGEVVKPHSGTAVVDYGDDDLVRRAAAVAAKGESGHLVGTAGTGPPAPDARATVPIVAYAPLTRGRISLGMSLLLVGATPQAEATGAGTGLLAVAALLGVLVLAATLLVAGLVGPVRRLREDALAVASGQPGARMRRQWISETHRIAVAFRSGAPEVRRRPSAVVAVVLATAALLAWSGAVLGTIGRHEVQVPGQAVQVTQRLAATTATALRRSLQQSLTDLRSFAALVGGTDLADLRPALQELTSRRDRYRSVYVVDQDGRSQVQAGRAPLRTEEPPPPGSGLHQQSVSHRVPVIYATAPLPGTRYVVVGELDVVKLSALVRLPGGVGRLVDTELRTVAATVGYQAYEPLAADPLRASVSEALKGVPDPAVWEVDGRTSVVASAALYGSKDFNDLQWAVVVEQPVSQLPLPGNHIRRTAWLAALVATVTALGGFGWFLLVLVLPLRRLAASADRFAAGDLGTVVHPQRPDEIGTVARCLELRRQSVEQRRS
ncbi:HAMP domain-containing protein [Lentzea sp. NPDC005914]|uniref:HAMP domain-containing protein n=1 Tax=Lentzea sp. NPDC005914 TaxID=3154572 RepID=UPI0033CDC6F0